MKPRPVARRTVLAAGFAGVATTACRAADGWDVPAAGIRQETFVSLGGVDQWVTIRGEDRANPVLVLIGGAGNAFGAPFSPFVRTFRPWERRYTLVQWDPQGTGKTFARAGRTIPAGVTLETLVADGLALVEYVRARLACDRVIALGVCGGSTVALKMIVRRPQAFSAFVSSGMVTEPPKAAERFYLERLRRRVAERADPADMAKLAELGTDPLSDPVRRADLFKLGAKYRPPNPPDQVREVVSAPNWSLLEAAAIPAGIKASWDRFGPHWEAVDLPALPREIPVPAALLYGEDNDIQPTAMAKAWLDRIQAPAKVWASIPVAGNHVMETHTEAFLALLERHVRPLAVRA
ncbi:alpha/beta hydrolase [Phenylobacterium sp.]|uniref:alpha/beta fold hydrolase n=1 Tax=Phenylobacterium sp. TaxID=1871053 RepID=UPI0025D90C47|nr:alpha/beta hydrolase [Phenylobacterium sp.]